MTWNADTSIDQSVPGTSNGVHIGTSGGTPVTGQSLGAGGAGIIGWLSAIAVAATASKPSAKSIAFDTGFNSKTAPTPAYAWATYKRWTIPGGATDVFAPLNFSFLATTVGWYGRLVELTRLASSNFTTTFTDGAATVDAVKEYWTDVQLEVVTSGNTTRTYTVTYTNEAGVTGRTATAASVANTLVAGNRVPIVLQAGDIGITDITNVTRSGALTVGSVDFWGIKEVCVVDAAYSTGIGLTAATSDGIMMRSGRIAGIEYAASGGAAVTVKGSFIGKILSEV